MRVSVDGVEYAPVGRGGGPRIGVAVTTHNEHEVLVSAEGRRSRRTPGAVVAVVDDGSKVPVTVPDSSAGPSREGSRHCWHDDVLPPW